MGAERPRQAIVALFLLGVLLVSQTEATGASSVKMGAAGVGGDGHVEGFRGLARAVQVGVELASTAKDSGPEAVEATAAVEGEELEGGRRGGQRGKRRHRGERRGERVGAAEAGTVAQGVAGGLSSGGESGSEKDEEAADGEAREDAAGIEGPPASASQSIVTGSGKEGGGGGGTSDDDPSAALGNVPTARATTRGAAHALKKGGAVLPKLPLADSRRGLRIALVANGKSLLAHTFGEDIDGHDLVCRFNFFVTKRFEKNVGSRTDIWFLGQLKMPGPKGFRGTKAVGHSLMNLTVLPERYVIPIAYEVGKTCTPMKPQQCRPSDKDVALFKKESSYITRLYSRYRIIPDKIEIMPQSYQIWLQRQYKYCHQFPSTGALALVYLMHHFPESTISVYGLDFLKNEIGHYWEKITKHRTIHNMKGEAKLVRELQATGRVIFKT